MPAGPRRTGQFDRSGATQPWQLLVGAATFRSQVGAVMRDDTPLTGLLAENIGFFDQRPDLGWMRECAQAAALDGEIMAMPMNHNTLVDDLGTGLSGGQRQRLLLARAVYRRPRILFMDEGASHLDLAREREVNAALAALRITRVAIAHRPETIAAADRVGDSARRTDRGRWPPVPLALTP